MMHPAQTVAPLFHGATPQRKPGRPKGSRAKVMQEPRALGVHHFAFVRSSLLGLDLRESFERAATVAKLSRTRVALLRLIQVHQTSLGKKVAKKRFWSKTA